MSPNSLPKAEVAKISLINWTRLVYIYFFRVLGTPRYQPRVDRWTHRTEWLRSLCDAYVRTLIQNTMSAGVSGCQSHSTGSTTSPTQNKRETSIFWYRNILLSLDYTIMLLFDFDIIVSSYVYINMFLDYYMIILFIFAIVILLYCYIIISIYYYIIIFLYHSIIISPHHLIIIRLSYYHIIISYISWPTSMLRNG